MLIIKSQYSTQNSTFYISGRCTMNLSETRPEAAPNSYFLDATATATNVCAAAGTCLIIDGAQYGGQVFSAVNGDVISGVVTGDLTNFQLVCLLHSSWAYFTIPKLSMLMLSPSQNTQILLLTFSTQNTQHDDTQVEYLVKYSSWVFQLLMWVEV